MDTSFTVLSVSANRSGTLSSSPVRMTPLYRMPSTVSRIRSTGLTIRCINPKTTNATTSRIRLPIHHKNMPGLSFLHGSLSRLSSAEESAEETLKGRHHSLHADAETLYWNGRHTR